MKEFTKRRAAPIVKKNLVLEAKNKFPYKQFFYFNARELLSAQHIHCKSHL